LAKRRSPFIGLYKHKHPELEIHYRSHNIKRNQIEQFKTVSQKSSLILRESLADFDVFIIDTIGILTKSTVMQTSLLWVVVWESWRS
jgi:hypothetical protein